MLQSEIEKDDLVDIIHWAIAMIYILELEDGKYYVGKSHNLESRLRSHFNGEGAVWTKRYKPIRVLKTIDTADEDSCTIDMMYKYGIENVRGGSYSTLILDDISVQSAIRAMVTKFDLRYKCLRPGHYGSHCKRYCTRCHRTSHYTDQCYASTTRYGASLIDDIDDIDEDEFVVLDSEPVQETTLACYNDIPQMSWYDLAVGTMEFVSKLSSEL